MKVVVAFLLISAPLICFQDTDGTLARAKSAYQANDPITAERILKALIRQQPGDLHALLLMGVVLDAQKRYAEAKTYYEQALKIAPDSAQVLNNIANHDLASGNASEARGLFERVVAVEPHHPNALLQLAQMSIDNNQGEVALSYLHQLSGSAASQAGAIVVRARALALCQRCSEVRETVPAVGKNVSDERASFSLGIAYAQCKLYQEAQRAFSHALDADPGNFEILYNLGLASLRSGDLNRAHSVLERALSVRPGDADVLRALAQTRVRLAFVNYHRSGAEAALRELDKTREMDRTSDDYLLRAQLLDSQGKVTEAAAALNQALRVAPKDITLYYEVVDFLLKHKLYQEADVFLGESLRIRPDDRDLLLARALTLNLLRRNRDSQILLEQIQTRWPEWDRVYLLTGMLLEMELKSEQARGALEKAIALGANTAEAYYYEAMAITHAAPQEVDAAQKAIKQALALNSDDPYIYLLAGKIALTRKEYSAAIKQLLEATRLEPSLIPAHYGLRHAYLAVGDEPKAEAEMQTIKHIASKTDGTDEGRFAAQDFLFAVKPPG